MPPRENELPEGTDHIINGAMETNGGGGASAGGGGGGGGGGSTGGSGAGATTGTETGGQFIAGRGDGTGGTAEAGGMVEQLRSQATALRDQAGGRVREFADGGKTRASDALEELSRVFTETAESIDERLGGEYGEYARKASDAVSGLADTLRRKEVDEIYDNVRDAVRKSPGVAIGVAAVVGFALARIVKAGFEEGGKTDRSNAATGKGGGDGASNRG